MEVERSRWVGRAFVLKWLQASAEPPSCPGSIGQVADTQASQPFSGPRGERGAQATGWTLGSEGRSTDRPGSQPTAPQVPWEPGPTALELSPRQAGLSGAHTESD